MSTGRASNSCEAAIKELRKLRLADLDPIRRAVVAQQVQAKSAWSRPWLEMFDRSPAFKKGHEVLKNNHILRLCLTEDPELFAKSVIATMNRFRERLRQVEAEKFSQDMHDDPMTILPRSHYNDIPGGWKPVDFFSGLWSWLLPYFFDAGGSKTEFVQSYSKSSSSKDRETFQNNVRRYLDWHPDRHGHAGSKDRLIGIGTHIGLEACVPFRADIQEVFATGVQIDSEHVRLIACYRLKMGWRPTQSLTLGMLGDPDVDRFEDYGPTRCAAFAVTFAEWSRLPGDGWIDSIRKMTTDRQTWLFDQRERLPPWNERSDDPRVVEPGPWGRPIGTEPHYEDYRLPDRNQFINAFAKEAAIRSEKCRGLVNENETSQKIKTIASMVYGML